jgi:hypothetical protein
LLYTKFYAGLNDAGSNFHRNISDFSETFDPKQEANESMDWLFAFNGTGLGMVGGLLLEKAFSFSKFFINNSTTQESLQETVISGVDMGMEKAPNAVKAAYVFQAWV